MSEPRRLPIYLVLDVSGSMMGEPIEAIKMGLKALLSDLNDNPQALETVWMSVITFGNDAKQILPLTELGTFSEPKLDIDGTTNLASALKLLKECVEREVRKNNPPKQKGDWKPLIFLMTDGKPDQGWESAADEIRKMKPGNLIACAAGPDADVTVLKKITEIVIKLQDCSPGTLGAFMKWMTDSITRTSVSVGAKGDAAIDLPALPQDKGIVIVP
jgi:uncharacterized protein YegL